MDPYWNDIIMNLNKDLADHEAMLIVMKREIENENQVIDKMKKRLLASRAVKKPL
jgi:hypothetical protein